MAYQVRYDFQNIKVEKIKKQTVLSYILAVVGLSVLLISCHFGGSMLDMFLLGNQENTRQAAGNMVESIRQGSGIENAIQTFCQELQE